MELHNILSELERRIQFLEIDHLFTKEKHLHQKTLQKAISQSTALIDFIKEKEKAVVEAREVNQRLKLHIDIIEKILQENYPKWENNQSTPKEKISIQSAKNQTNDQSFADDLLDADPSTFISPLSLEEWSAVPKYMKGRMTCDKINEYICTLNAMLEEFVRISKISYNKLTKDQKDRILEYKNMALPETTGKLFLLEADIKNATEKTDMVLKGFHTILRHFAKIKEVRGGGHNRIIVC